MTDEQQLNATIKKAAVPSGLIYGIVSLVMAIFTFYFITSMTSSLIMMSAGPILFSILIPIVIAVFITIDLRKKIGGYWSFRQATTGVFIMFFVGFIVTYIGRDLVFAKLVEPNMLQKTEDAFVNGITNMLEKNGADQAKIDEQVDKIKQNFESQKVTGIVPVLKTFAYGVIFTFVFALIFGAIFKKDPPLFDTPLDPETV